MGYYKNKAIDAEFLGPEYWPAINRWWDECYGEGMSQMKLFTEKDPHGRDLKGGGAKADAGKAPIVRGFLDYFPRACQEVAAVSAKGAEKYSWKGWESVPDGVARYTDALGRHLVQESIGGPFDADTGLLHKAQVAWNALASLELYLREQEKKGV